MCQAARGLQPQHLKFSRISTPVSVRFHGGNKLVLCDQTQANQHESKADNKQKELLFVVKHFVLVTIEIAAGRNGDSGGL